MSADILVVPKIESKGHHLSIVLAKQRLDISCKGGAIVRYAEKKNISISESSDFRYEIVRGIVAQVECKQIAMANRAHLVSVGVNPPSQTPASRGTSVLEVLI